MYVEPMQLKTPMPIPSATRSRGSSGPGDEEALLEGLQAQDEACYELLVRRYGGRMLAVAQRLCRNDDEARDVVQEAFLSAFKGIHRFRRGARLGTWLHRITVNAALMRLRRASSHPEVQIDDLLLHLDRSSAHAGVGLAARPPSAERRLLRRETHRMVRASIDRLPATCRTVLLLREIEELSTSEVAEMLGVTPNAVKIRLHRARQALARVLSENA